MGESDGEDPPSENACRLPSSSPSCTSGLRMLSVAFSSAILAQALLMTWCLRRCSSVSSGQTGC